MTDKEYFKDTKYVSNSMLGWLKTSPQYYYRKLNSTDDDDEKSYLKFGTAVHHYLLENDTFSDNYIVSENKKPSNTIQNKFCNLLIASQAINDNSLLYAYKMSYSVSKKKDEDILINAKRLYEENKDYVDFERNRGSKIALNKFEYDKIISISNNIKKNKYINEMLFSVPKNGVAYNEKIILFKLDGIDTKAKIDRFVIDFDNKTIKLIDLKTFASKFENENHKEKFRKSFESFGYGRQLSFYNFAITQFLINEYPDINFDEFKFESIIIAAKSNFDNEVRMYLIEEDVILRNISIIIELLGELKFYREYGYDMTLEAYNNNGLEKLL